MNSYIFVAAVVSLYLFTATAVGGSILYVTLYLSAFVALVPGNSDDFVTFWDLHASKNMMTVFVCVEVLLSRIWAAYECFRVVNTDCVGSAIESRKWALCTMWISIGFVCFLDAATNVYIYTKDQTCKQAMSEEIRVQNTFAALCAQSDHNQLLISILQYVNLGFVLLTGSLFSVNLMNQIQDEKRYAEEKKK